MEPKNKRRKKIDADSMWDTPEKIIKERDPVGKLALELIEDAKHLDHTPFEQMQAMLQDYQKNLETAVFGCRDTLHPDDEFSHSCPIKGHQLGGLYLFENDFFIEVLTKKDPLLKNVISIKYIPRSTCPTPTYDQSVYKFHRATSDCEHQWTLPDQGTYDMMKIHALEIDESGKELLEDVLRDASGELLIRCKELNGENLQTRYDKVLLFQKEGHA